VSVVATLSFAASSASAHGPRLGAVNTSELVAGAAQRLNATTARLTTAITNAAIARIDEAAREEDVDADDADDLKEEARESLRYAIALSRTRTVAANLGITTARLNTAFRATRRALIIERIDEAVEDGDLEADEAAELKEDLEDAELPGYKSFGLGGRGFGFGRG
jgi:hydroxypyruvate isomerase